ncbi:hypothetical protein ABEB36_000536 [Hypothenemus hampei]|uniref:Mitochondrial cardiolipin hydrolase n=1 Tax=Hypothenemus hampei TaxID=57062 RepID=A0ABD1FDH4_HYPHA
MSNIIAVSLSLTLTVIPIFLRYFVKKHYEKLLKDLDQPDNNCYYECVFIDYKNFYCKPHLINRQECGDHCSYTQLKRLLHYITSAKKSVSMCMYTLTLRQVTEELVKVSQKGVTVRLITDKVMAKTTPVQSNLNHLAKYGINYKVSRSTNEMMHHKFCLIDEKDPQTAKVFFGTINLTAQGFCKNFESLIYTNDKNIIQRLSTEFEQLWLSF